MNRPEGISPEAWEKALKCSCILSGDYEKHVNDIALAIQSSVEAERERAARLAETYGANMSIWVSSEWPTAKLSGNYAGQDIAQAIRKGA